MRISDWSSDVCSSDLAFNPSTLMSASLRPRALPMARPQAKTAKVPASDTMTKPVCHTACQSVVATTSNIRQGKASQTTKRLSRSEEHTSELQSLMRISFAVFCLNKKKKNKAISQVEKSE